MIYGIGIDIVKTDRMTSVVEKWGERFLGRVFTENEIAYCYGKKNPYLSLSVRFAAKEALIKALDSDMPFSLREIDVLKHAAGRPVIRVKGRLKAIFDEKAIRFAHLSMSHERQYGIACVVLEGA